MLRREARWRHAVVRGHDRVPQIARRLAIARALPAAACDAVGGVVVVRAIDRVGIPLTPLDSGPADEAQLRGAGVLRREARVATHVRPRSVGFVGRDIDRV